MKLPNAENAIVEDSKLYLYLLSHDHRDGRHKARFFRKRGYSDDLAGQLRADLIGLAQRYPVNKQIEKYDGMKYVVEGAMIAPDGSVLEIRTVWFIRIEEDFPRFVTAYPL